MCNGDDLFGIPFIPVYTKLSYTMKSDYRNPYKNSKSQMRKADELVIRLLSLQMIIQQPQHALTPAHQPTNMTSELHTDKTTQ